MTLKNWYLFHWPILKISKPWGFLPAFCKMEKMHWQMFYPEGAGVCYKELKSI